MSKMIDKNISSEIDAGIIVKIITGRGAVHSSPPLESALDLW